MPEDHSNSKFPIALPNYQFQRLLDRGGMGAVYLAEQQNPVREVAIKIIAPDDLPRSDPEVRESVLAMLRDEGNVAARFNHENLITVHECGVLDGHYYLVMEYLPGGSLRERIGTGLDPAESHLIIRRLAEGLAEMHAQGVLHRDIKPENVLFRKNGKPVLMDYGVAKDEGSISKLTQLGLSTGTPEYMSPEQVDERPIDARSDLYALGVLFHELLTGEVPYSGKSAMAIAYAHVNHPLPRLPEELADNQTVLDRLLAKDPSERFQNAAEVIAALDPNRPATGAPTRVTPTSSPRPRVTVVGELRRRKVLHTAGFYGVTAFGVTEILTFVFENFGFPAVANQLVAILFVAGFPMAMFLSWAFDLEPGGKIRRTRFSGQSSRPIIALSIVLLLMATGGLYWLIDPDPPPYEPEPGAYEQVIRGREQLNLRTTESLLAAEQHFQRAIEIDPDYALGYVGLADTYAWLSDFVPPSEMDYFSLGKEMAEKGVSLDPGSGEAFVARGRYRQFDGRIEEAAEDYRTAIELSPDEASIRYEYGTFLMGQGNLEEAVAQRRLAAELDPLSPVYAWGVASMMAEAGRVEGALAQLKANINRFPTFEPNYTRIRGLLVDLGRLGEAQVFARRFRMSNPRVADHWAEECIGYLHLAAPEATGDCLAQFAKAHPDDDGYHDVQAHLHRYRGEIAEALTIRRMLFERNPNDGFRAAQLAELLHWQGELEEAEQRMADAFPRLLNADVVLPNNHVIVIRAVILAAILHDLGEMERRDVLLNAIELATAQMEPWSYGVVEVLVQTMRGDQEAAIAALAGAIDAGWKRYWWSHTHNAFLQRQGVLSHPDFIALMERLKPVIDEQRRWFEDNKDRQF